MVASAICNSLPSRLRSCNRFLSLQNEDCICQAHKIRANIRGHRNGSSSLYISQRLESLCIRACQSGVGAVQAIGKSFLQQSQSLPCDRQIGEVPIGWSKIPRLHSWIKENDGFGVGKYDVVVFIGKFQEAQTVGITREVFALSSKSIFDQRFVVL